MSPYALEMDRRRRYWNRGFRVYKYRLPPNATLTILLDEEDPLVRKVGNMAWEVMNKMVWTSRNNSLMQFEAYITIRSKANT